MTDEEVDRILAQFMRRVLANDEWMNFIMLTCYREGELFGVVLEGRWDISPEEFEAMKQLREFEVQEGE